MKLIFKDGSTFEVERFNRELGNYNGRLRRLSIILAYGDDVFDDVTEKLTDDNVSSFKIVSDNSEHAFEGYAFENVNEDHSDGGTTISLRFLKSADGSKINTEDDQEIPESNLDDVVPGVAIPDPNEE